MKFNARIRTVKIGRDSAGDVFLDLTTRLYQIPMQGKIDAKAASTAMWLSGLPFHMKENEMVEIDITDPT